MLKPRPSIERKRPADITEEPAPRPAVMGEDIRFYKDILLTYRPASVDEHAFRTAPEVGTAPDMINDDLPTNLDYLDESFGTAAGLRELTDDDLDEFDIGDVGTGPPNFSLGTQQEGIISRVGGETIKMLSPDGIHIIENFFETLPPDSSDGNKE
jgi:autophagy-related protein 2